MAEKHDAQDFYARMAGINDSLDMFTSQWHQLRDSAMVNKNFSALAPARIQLGSFIASSRAAVANILPNGKNEGIKKDLQTLLETQSGKVAEVYPAFEQLTEFTPKETVEKNLKALGDDLLSEKAASSAIRSKLELYSIKYELKKKKK
jgi:hypothetical protein